MFHQLKLQIIIVAFINKLIAPCTKGSLFAFGYLKNGYRLQLRKDEQKKVYRFLINGFINTLKLGLGEK